MKDKETGNESKMTYKAYQDTQSRFNLIGQVDENGNLIDGDPNLNPQHRRAPSVKSAAVADVGKVEKPLTEQEILDRRQEVINQFPADNPIIKLNQEMLDQEKAELKAKEEPRVKRQYTKRVKENA